MTSIIIINAVLTFVVLAAIVGGLGWAIVADHRLVRIAEIEPHRRRRTQGYRGVHPRVQLSRELG